MNDKVQLNLGMFLDQELDALPDAPTFEVLPAGRHVVMVKNVEMKDANDKENLVITFKHVATEELANPADTAPKAGTEFNMFFSTTTAGGLGALKDLLKNIKSPGVKTSELLQAIVNQQFRIVSRVRKWKDKSSGEQREGWNVVDGLQFINAG